MKRDVIALVLLVTVASDAAAQMPSPSTHAAPELAPILQSRVHRLRASAIADDYRITVMLPRSYDRDSTRRYPVVVLTDGNWLGPVAAPLAWDLSTVRHPEVILVGVDLDVSRFGDTGGKRLRDLTPVYVVPPPRRDTSSRSASPPIVTGGGPAFLAFIADDVLPLVDATYRTTTTDRTLAGYSLGGLFTLYALVERPTLFRRYIAISPSLWWADGAITKRLQELPRSPAHDSARVFVSVGGAEGPGMLNPVRAVESALQGREGGAANWHFQVFPDEIHESGWPAALSGGLRYVLGVWPVPPR